MKYIKTDTLPGSGPLVKAAVLGLGRIGWKLELDPRREKPATHLGALRSLKNVEVVGAWDIDPKIRQDFHSSSFARKGFPWGPKIPVDFSTAQELLAQVSPDIVCLATWPDSHLELTRLCVNAGVPVVVCEKPLALDLKEAQNIADLEGTGPGKTRILTNHERRYSLDYLWVRKQIAEKTFGEMLFLRGRLYLGKNRKPGITLLHDGTHLLDILRFLSGSEWKGKSVLGDPQKEGGSLTYLGEWGKFPSVLEFSGSRDHMVFEVEINFERGRILVGNGVLQAWESKKAPWARGFNALAPYPVKPPAKTGYFRNLMSDGVNCVLDPLRIPQSRSLDGLAAMKTIEALLGLSSLGLKDFKEAPADSNKPELPVSV